jgi:hypothetical protein
VKDLVFRLRINSAKDLGLWRGVDSVKDLVFRLRINSVKDLVFKALSWIGGFFSRFAPSE